MMEPGSEEHDVYVAQLQEVFDSCDSGGDGRITQQELVQLCSRLQLEDQADALVTKLLGDNPKGTVTFDQFKEGFVAVLSQSVEGLDATSEEEEPSTAPDLSDGDVSPKFVKGSKKYGRRSRPVGAAAGEETPEYSDTDISGAEPSPGRTKRQKMNKDNTEIDPDELKIPLDDTPDTFEAEGQLNQSIADMEKALDPVSEEAHLRDIWRELGVGTDGYLTLNELGTVCDHIGMDEMNAEELQHLFDKLDVDSDGRVSFHEFLHGLFQHGGPVTPSVTPVRPLSTPRQKLRMSVVTFDDRPQTPSFIATISGLFSTIDADSSGYASADEIVELWEKLGVSHGHEILEYLQFDTSTKVALADLSSALEQEMRTVEEDNATYQAAVVSYQHELKYLKAMSDTAGAERDKLRQDLLEANQRIALLIKEGDERQVAGDDKREREMMSLETRYQEQIRALQSELDGEKEAITAQSARHRTRLESEVGRLKEDEARLREKLSQTQRELERLENDILEMAEKCADLEKVNTRQQRELEEAEGIKLRLEELESTQAQIAEEQSRWQSDRLNQLETERKDLKDKNDELTMETEELRQQLASSRRKSRTSRPHDPAGTPNRTGSVLSDYQRPSLLRRSSDYVSSEDEEGSLSGSGRIRRRLPQPPTSGEEEALRAEVDMLKRECANQKKELEELRKLVQEKTEAEEEAEQRFSQLNRNFSIERKDIEQSYKLEITDIEEQYATDKERLMQRFEREKEMLREELEADQEERLTAQEVALREAAEEEKRDVLIRVESEKNLLKQQLNEERAKLRESLEEELEKEMTSRLRAVEEQYTHQIEALSTQEKNGAESLHQRVAELELQLKLQREELELQFSKDREALREAAEQERSVLHQKYRTQITELENSLSAGEAALQGKLKEDFHRLLDQHRAQVVSEEALRSQEDLLNLSSSVSQQHQEERARMLSDNQRHIDELEESNRAALEALEKEKRAMITTLEETHAAAVASLRASYDRRLEEAERAQEESRQEQQKLHEREQVALEEQLARTCEELISAQTLVDTERSERQSLQRALREAETQQRRHLQVLEGEKEEAERERREAERRAVSSVNREDLEQEIEAEVQARLEDDFLAQIERLKAVFCEERDELEKQIQLLQKELEEQQREQLDHQLTSTDAAAQGLRLEKLTQENLALRGQRAELEQRVEDVNQHYRRLLEDKDTTRRQLEEQIRTMESRADVVSGGGSGDVVRPVSVSALSSAHSSSPVQQQQRSDQAILDALARQQRLLETTKGELKSEIRGLGMVPTTTETTSTAQSLRVGPSQEDLVQELEHTTARVVELETALSLAQSEHQRELRTLRASLGEMVAPSELNKLREALSASQQKARQLEDMWEQRATETSKMIKSSSESHQAALRQVEMERDELARQLETKQHLLNQQVAAQRQILEKNSRRDLLIKDLYVENANLVKSLYETERREKEINSRASKLQDRCAMLQVVVQKVTTAALA